MTTHDTNSWERYWAGGSLTSCSDACLENYTGVLRSLWDKRFAALPDGTRILDIGTGNGAIALLAAAAARRLDRRFIIDALDQAAIDPPRNLRGESRALLPDIHFHPCTDVCHTGFDNDSFDLITGNFALEYTDWPSAIRELARVTAPDGENLFVIHSTGSVILDSSTEELAHIDFLLNVSAVLDHADELIATIGRLANGSFTTAQKRRLSTDPAIEKCRLAFNQAASKVAAMIDESAHPEILMTVLGRISEAYSLAQSCDAATALEHLQQTRQEIDASAARLSGLQRAAMSQQDIDRIVLRYESAGFTDIVVDTLADYPSGRIGWTLRVRSI